jgi:gliding motility-associated-like protein
VTVTVNPLPVVNFSLLPPVGCVPLEVSFADSTLTDPGSYYSWNFGDGHTDTLYHNPVHTYYEPGTYYVSLTVTTQFGCVGSLTLNDAVNVYDLPVAAFTPDPARTTILNPRITFYDQSYDAISWQWDFGDGTGNSFEQNPWHTYQDTGTYKITLYVSNQYGCRDTAWENLIIDGDFTIYVPNAFSPNGDGVNETFLPQGIGIHNLEMIIFDRWGKKVYVSSSSVNGWDGRHMNNDEPCVQDVYVYLIRATDLFARDHEFTGRVTLVR